jgi:hypothetical protein
MRGDAAAARLGEEPVADFDRAAVASSWRSVTPPRIGPVSLSTIA